MRKTLLIIYLIFSLSNIIYDILTNFKNIKYTYYTLNYFKNFQLKRFYYIKSPYSERVNGRHKGIDLIIGKIENTTEERIIRITSNNRKKYMKLDSLDNIYYNIWYQKETDVITLKTKNNVSLDYRGLLRVIFFYIGVIFIVTYFTRLKRKQLKIAK